MPPPLLQRQENWLSLVQATPGRLQAWGLHLQSHHPGALIRLMRGQKSRTSPAFFDEWSAALQFPHSWAANWGAMEEALHDLRLTNPKPHLLLVSYGLDLLAEAPDHEFRAFFEICRRVHESWARPSRPENIPAQAFHIVLQETAPSLNVLAEKLASHGFPFQSLDLESAPSPPGGAPWPDS